ncbi:hypothetical protein VE03_10126 [Pseudogymnoascus sp. 23342-1-I1]|nr:hypothetical protein VE03_10126 [Pseudogymnoascus sp. 23342-1-I1]
MPDKATLCWDVGGNHLITTNEELYLNLTEDEIATREKQVRYEKIKLEQSKWLVCQLKSLARIREYPDKKDSNKMKIFSRLLEKYFIGDEWEIKILRALRPDNFVLLCWTFNLTLFKTIPEIGLQDNFAEVINGFFENHWKIPQWVVRKAKKTMENSKSLVNFKSEADNLQEKLNSYLPQGSKQFMKSLPTTSSLGTHSTGVGGRRERQHVESRKSFLPPSTSGGRFLAPIPREYGISTNPISTTGTTTTSTTTTNTEASLTSPNLPQTAGYGLGQQNHHMPQASYPTQSPNNYMQYETHQQSKRQRVEGSQNTTFNGIYWDQTVTPLSTSHGPHFTAHQPDMLGMIGGEVQGNGLGQHNIPRR